MKRSQSRLASCAALFLLLAAWSAPALGQPKPGTAEAAKQADALFLEGKTLLKSGKKREARDKYLAALALKKSYDVAGNVGSLEVDLGLYREAAEHLSYALKTYSTSGSTPEQIEKARQRLAEAKKHVATLSVTVNVDGAEVFVDGVSVGRAPLSDEVFVEPGARVIEAKLAGYQDAKREVAAVIGGAVEVPLMLAAGAGVDGTKGIAPLEPDVKPPGDTKEERRTRGGVRRPLIIAGAATSAALIAAGGVFAILSSAKASNADQQAADLRAAGGPRPCGLASHATACEELDSVRAMQGTLSNLSLWTFVAGGVLGAGTTVYALMTAKPNKRTALHVEPVVLSGGGGVFLTGCW